VALTARSGIPSIFLVSWMTLVSSSEYPVSSNVPMCGRALNAMGWGYTEGAGSSPARWPADCTRSSSMAAAPVPDTAW